MTIYFNNEATTTSSTWLHDFIHEVGLSTKNGIAVALNQNVIPKIYWNETRIEENDNILIITATQGG